MLTTSERGLSRQKIVAELTKSVHGKLSEYVPVGLKAASQEPEFLAHLIAWDREKGQIRDAKVALPVVTLSERAYPVDLVENSLAHVAMLPPRDVCRAVDFARSLKIQGQNAALKRTVTAYLRAREKNWSWWERTALQHRAALHRLYAYFHVKPHAMADEVLFKGRAPKGTIFEAVKNLPNMSAKEAAGTIMERRIPFLVAVGALGAKARETDLVLALMERMTPIELVTNTGMLERLGIKTIPELKAAYESGLKRVAASKKNTLKAARAIGSVKDEGLREKLRGAQEKQLQALGGIDGDWVVLADKSGSMGEAIETGRQVASLLAKMVRGEVHLVFFDVAPRYINATGKDYDRLLEETRRLAADGGTSIGCGLRYVMEAGFNVDGIAIISDACENEAPLFADVYRQLAKKLDREPPVYLYKITPDMREQIAAFARAKGLHPSRVLPEQDSLTPSMTRGGFEMSTYELGASVDYYSLPNIVQTMRVRRYTLFDEILATPLLTMEQALKRKEA